MMAGHEANRGWPMRDDWRRAAIAGDLPRIERLLAQGVDVDARDKYGQTALMLAAMHGRAEVARVLVDHGGDLDVTAKFGLSALMLAVINRHEAIARRLVDAGADTLVQGTGAPGFAGKTAAQLAEHGGLDDLAAYISGAARRNADGA